MADKTPAEKLRLKPGMTALLLHVPAELDGVLGVPAGAVLVNEASEADWVLDFATTQSEAEERMRGLAANVKASSLTWIGYPKGSKAAGYDLNRDTLRLFGETVGFIVNQNFSLDEKWSAVGMKRSS